MQVPVDELVLAREPNGTVARRQLGDLSLSERLPAWNPVSGDALQSGAPATEVHQFTGVIRKVKMGYGRSLRAADGSNMLALRDGVLHRTPVADLRLGDLVAAPRLVDRGSSRPVEIDIFQLLRASGKDFYIEGASVERLNTTAAVERMARASARYGDEPRICIPESEWAKIITTRVQSGLRQRDVALALGYKQPITVSQWERGQVKPAQSAFEAYLDLLGLDWPSNATSLPSVLAQSRPEVSANVAFRKTSGRVLHRALTPAQAATLGRDVTLRLPKGQTSIPRFLPLDESFCEFLGWYAAEGSVSRGRVAFALGADDDPLIPALCSLVERVTGLVPHVHRPSGRPNSRTIYVDDVTTAAWLSQLLPGNAHTKRVPDVLFNVDATFQMAFLRGLYLGDGTKDRRHYGVLGLVHTVSRSLVDGVSVLLLQLGLLGGTTPYDKPNAYVDRCVSYVMRVTGDEQVRALHPVWMTSPRRASIYEALSEARFTRTSVQSVSETLVVLPVTGLSDEVARAEPVRRVAQRDVAVAAGFAGGALVVA